MVARVTTYGELLAASQRHPMIRYDVAPDAQIAGWQLAGAVAYARFHPTHGRYVTILGREDGVVALLDTPEVRELLFGDGRVGGLTVPVDVFPEVARRFTVRRGHDWEWMSTTQAPAVQSAEDRLIELGPEAEAELHALLQEHNPRTEGAPFVRSPQRWIGVRDGARLVACGCAEPNAAGYPVLSGITVDPAHRGRGLGAAVTAALTRAAVAEAGVCTLGMYSDTPHARDIYHRLGYVTGAAISSRIVQRR